MQLWWAIDRKHGHYFQPWWECWINKRWQGSCLVLAAFPAPEVLIIPFLAVINIGRGDTLDLVGEETNTSPCHACHHSADQKQKRRKDAVQRGGGRMLFPHNVQSKDGCPSIWTGQYLWTGPSYAEKPGGFWVKSWGLASPPHPGAHLIHWSTILRRVCHSRFNCNLHRRFEAAFKPAGCQRDKAV